MHLTTYGHRLVHTTVCQEASVATKDGRISAGLDLRLNSSEMVRWCCTVLQMRAMEETIFKGPKLFTENVVLDNMCSDVLVALLFVKNSRMYEYRIKSQSIVQARWQPAKALHP